MGVRGSALDLFRSYLSDRFQYVSINNTYSNLLPISTGVPQGSVLGPLLFIIYVNDIVNSFKSDHVLFILYADDTNIFVTGSSPADLHLRLQAIIAALEKYFYCNILHLNSSKSRVVYFRSPRANLSFHPNLFMADTLVESVEKIKFLGVTINSTLSWTDHIESISNKLSSSIGCLRAMCGSIPESFYKPVYCAFIQSHILYGLSVWGSGGSSTKLLQIFRAQKRALRTIFGNMAVLGGAISTAI